MTDLTLFIDPYETEYPGPVRELLSQAPRKSNICASITHDYQCLFLCSNVLYIFPSKDTGIPSAYKLSLPNTGLLYSANSICIFKSPNFTLPHPSVIVVSPEGVVRYWSDVTKPHHDERLNLNNEVTFSICLIESLDHLHRFLISTTTAPTFYIVEIYYNNSQRSENISFHTVEMNSAAGIGRRMSMLLFGSFSSEKELILKTLFVRGLVHSKVVDIVAVLPKSLRFFSMKNQSLLHEANIVEMFTEQRRDQQIVASNVSILDADIYQKGILMLIVATSSKDRFTNVNFYIGYLKERQGESEQYSASFLPVLLPDSLSQMESSKLTKCKLFVINSDECVVILPNSILSLKHPNSDAVDAVVLNEINDTVLGAAVVDGLCHIVLKDNGICALRRLPQHFDLRYWRKYRQILEHIDDGLLSDDLLKNAYLAFCAKNLSKAKQLVDTLLQKLDVNVAELTVELDKYFLDCKPTNIRWTADENLIDSEQREWLKKQTLESANFQLIFDQLEDKLCHHNMIVLFLQQFHLLNKVDCPISTMYGRSGIAVLAEYGEKLILMTLTITWLVKQHQNALPPLIVNAIKSLAQEFTRRFQHPDTPFLTAFDHVFNEVSNFGELISTVVSLSDKMLKRNSKHPEEHFRIIVQVGAFLSVMAEGIMKAKESERYLIVPLGTPNWLNELLIHFIRHLNFAFDFLDANRELANIEDNYSMVLMHNIAIAKFVLSQQEQCRRENSRIIERFLRISEIEVALDLAETFHDFTTLIEYCHKNLSEKDCQEMLNRYKLKFEANDFDLFLYDYYRKKGMVNYLLAEKGSRLNQFLSEHENINWIKNIDNGEYSKACRILKGMAFDATSDQNKLIILSLCKLCVLCDAHSDMGELAEFSDSIRILSEKLHNENIAQPIPIDD